MSAAQVAIVNRALSRLGVRLLVSDMAEQSTEGEYARLFYGPCLRETLALLDWRFASRQVQLAVSGTAPQPWAYQYLLPADCLTPREVFKRDDQLARGSWEWRDVNTLTEATRREFATGLGMDGGGASVRALWCDVPDALLRYTAQVDDPSLWEPAFASALAFTLAAEFAAPMTGKVELRTAMLQARAGDLAQAAANTAQGWPRRTSVLADVLAVRQ